MNFKRIFSKYKNIIFYMFFGVCTTAVNIITYWYLVHLTRLGIMYSTIIAWIVAVLFAYTTNRKWVFYSKANGVKEITKELITFFEYRIITGIIDWLCMFVFAGLLNLNDMIIKVSANIIVIVLNYLASKLIIFSTKGEKNI